jgi:glycerophosphoryl diester phosphodiesterase
MNMPQHSWPYPTLFAHRGGGSLAPENTLAAIKTGYARGFGAFEFDVKLTRDGVAILMHDDTLDRTTNGRGAIVQMDLAAIEKLDAGSWHSLPFAREPVPHFSAVAHYLHGLGLLANVEIKPCPGREAETGRIVAELCVELWRDRLVKPLVSSFSTEALHAARAVSEELPIGLLVREPKSACLAQLRSLQCVSLHCHHGFINADTVRQFHDEGYRLLVYTVNQVDRAAELLDFGVDGIFTDELETMARRFPGELADANKPMRNRVDLDMSWLGAVPPMP